MITFINNVDFAMGLIAQAKVRIVGAGKSKKQSLI